MYALDGIFSSFSQKDERKKCPELAISGHLIMLSHWSVNGMLRQNLKIFSFFLVVEFEALIMILSENFENMLFDYSSSLFKQ